MTRTTVAKRFFLVASGASVALAGIVIPDGRFSGNMLPPPLFPPIPGGPERPVFSQNGTELPPYNTTYYFDQRIDHDNPELGTFKQRYFHTYEFYEPGGPIILSTPGESNVEGYDRYLTNVTLHGMMAQRLSGSVIILEHRFYGQSNPRPDLTSDSLKLLTIQQAIDDLVYFAENVELPMPNGGSLGPKEAPWILVGGSYSGALTSWTLVNKPGVFFAGFATSGVVEAILDFWRYFEPIRVHMPTNCSADVASVISHVDRVFTGNDSEAIQTLKETFGMGDIDHLDDVAGALRNNLWDWQSLQPSTGPGARFYQFCDALEVKEGVNAPAQGWGLDYALSAWGSYFKNIYLGELCGDRTALECFGTYNASQTMWTDTSVDNWARSWMWQVCTEVGFFQDGPPRYHPGAIVSRIIRPSYDLRQCQMMFPKAFKESLPNPSVKHINRRYKGWDVRLERMFFSNAIRDPWRDATISAEGLNVKSTPLQPIAVSDAFHCSDFNLRNGEADPSVAAVQRETLDTIAIWMNQWKPEA